MTQTPIQTWCDRLQAKLMAALDAAWETIAASDDPALIRKARDKAKACGEIAAQARKIAAMTPAPKRAAPPAWAFAGQPSSDVAAEARAPRALDRLKGGGRGRL